MKLVDTIKGMLSDNYYERLMAEYDQLYIRYMKLKHYMDNYRKNPYSLEFHGDIELLEHQLEYMREYLQILHLRIDKEGYYHDDKIK